MGREEGIRKSICFLSQIVILNRHEAQDVPRELQGMTTDQLTNLTRAGLSVDQKSQQAAIEMQRSFVIQLSSKESPKKSVSHWTTYHG